jgi:hypothetical protein
MPRQAHAADDLMIQMVTRYFWWSSLVEAALPVSALRCLYGLQASAATGTLLLL